MLGYLQCEFLSIIFLIVYVGAISILFLFIVMLLNIRNIELTDKIFNYFPISFFIILLFLILLNFLVKEEFYFIFTSLDMYYIYIEFLNNIDVVFEMTLLSFMLYEEYYFIFLLAAVLLFVAMVGAILLTLQVINNTRKQLIYSQVYRHVFLKIFKNEN
jgi:NADH:ubiquinone oxidoreductase subunit 6 (subunit J)